MSRRPRALHSKALAGLLALGLLGACSPAPVPSGSPTAASPGPSTTAASGSPIPTVVAEPARWSDCGGRFQCATLSVPRDYADPSHGHFDIALVKLPATDPAARIGSLVVNPGGPGGSGVEFVRENVDLFPRELRRRFDLVGFDPRGVNLSSRVRCFDNLDGHFALDPSPDDRSELEALVDEAHAFADACQQRNAAALPWLSTDDVARDLESIRHAVRDEKLTYLGFSYGTLIGALYAAQFPGNIRAMVLDGAIDPALDLEQLRAGQAQAFEAALGRFFARCAKERCLFAPSGRPEAAFDRLMAAIDTKPLPATRARDARRVGPGLAEPAVLAALYSDASWPLLDAALALAQRGDGSLLLAMSDPFRGRKPNGTYSNQQDAYTANICLDFAAPNTADGFEALVARIEPEARHFAGFAGYTDLPCLFWPVAAERNPAPVRADGAPPIVVVGSTGDTATPYAWAKALADELATGVLLTRKGEGHTAFGASGCIQRAVTSYLVGLHEPPNGETCQ